ncbi:antitoxin for the HicAB toxin-antitoxin system [Gammaproteobacteria bacterium]|nr:antitoxin for the HicAB toxin-antitoxin system [Gammaproteobacteria bacterium]
MYYPASFEKNEKGLYTVICRDIPEAATCGDNYDDALFMAQDVLLVALDFYFDKKRIVPTPSVAQEGDVLIELPASAWAKVLLLNELISQNVSQSELARRLQVQKQQVTRLVNLHHATKIDFIASALAKLDKTLVLSVQ